MGWCPLLSTIGVCVAGLAFVLTCVGVRSTNWEEATYKGELYEDGLFTVTFPEPWRKAAAAMIIIGILLGVACVLAVCLYIKYIDNVKYEIMQLLGMVFAFAAGFFVLVAVIIFDAERQKIINTVHVSIGSALVLAACGGTFFVIAGIILAIEKCKISSGNKVMIGD